MEQEFDYSLVDNETADFLRSCEYEMNGIAEDARVKFGRVLKRVQEKLSNHHDGVFVKWYESGGMNKNDVYYAINVYEISTNLENSKKENFLNAPKSLQKEVMKKNAPEDLKEKVYDGEIKTNKEYQELKRQLEQAESTAEIERKERERLERENEELANDEPEIIEKEVTKEIDKTDYERGKYLEEQIKMLGKRYEYLSNEDEKEKELKHLNYESNKSVLTLKLSSDEFLKYYAINAFRKGAIASASEPTRERRQEGVDEMKDFFNEIEVALSGRIDLTKQEVK